MHTYHNATLHRLLPAGVSWNSLTFGFAFTCTASTHRQTHAGLVCEVNVTLDPSTDTSVNVLLTSSWGPRPAQGSFSFDLLSVLAGISNVTGTFAYTRQWAFICFEQLFCGQNLRKLYDFKFLFTQSMDTFLLTICHSKRRFHPRAYSCTIHIF